MQEDTDRQRAGYLLPVYIHQAWGMGTNYDLTIDSARCGIPGSVSLVMEALRSRADPAGPARSVYCALQ